MSDHEMGSIGDRIGDNSLTSLLYSGSLPNSLIYSPISDWSNDEVWLYLGLAEKARKAYKQWFPRRSKTGKMQEKVGKAGKTLAQIKIHVPTITHRTAII
jgi:3'-phosphoadenosine 5'-phosphosulfate sulfotransferase (PAPS reductase)/FAD synthetase